MEGLPKQNLKPYSNKHFVVNGIRDITCEIAKQIADKLLWQ